MENIKKLLRNLDTKKASQDTDIPIRIIKSNSNLFAHFILKDYSDVLIKSEFPQNLKNANVTPVYKKNLRNEESNYMHVSILSSLFKVCEKWFFVLGFSSQHCLLVLIEK